MSITTDTTAPTAPITCPSWCSKSHTAAEVESALEDGAEGFLLHEHVILAASAEVGLVQARGDVLVDPGDPVVVDLFAGTAGREMTPGQAREVAAALLEAAAMVERATEVRWERDSQT